MRQIDQDPKGYRAQPLKGEPVFLPGSGRKVALFILALLIGLGAAIVTSPVYWLSCTFLTKTCV